MKLRDKFTFGKHKGKSLRWVIDNEPTYVAWAIEEEIITLHPRTRKELEARLEAYYDDKYDGLSWGDLEF